MRKSVSFPRPVAFMALAAAIGAPALALAQTAQRDGIADLLKRGEGAVVAQSSPRPQAPPAPAAQPPAVPAEKAEAPRDPREGDAAFEQAQRLMKAIDAILQDTAKNRGESKKLPSKEEFLIPPIWTETREDREKKIKDLLDAALGIVTDVPVEIGRAHV